MQHQGGIVVRFSPAFLEYPPEETTSRLAAVPLRPLAEQAIEGPFPLESR